jgi:hypothetical protein
MDHNVLFFGKGELIVDMTVMEFFVGMSLCRKGPLSGADVARDVSRWFDCNIDAGHMMGPLMSVVERGWARVEQGFFSILDDGVEAVRGFYVAMVRLLDAGKGFLDVAVMLSIVREFEGKEG